MAGKQKPREITQKDLEEGFNKAKAFAGDAVETGKAVVNGAKQVADTTKETADTVNGLKDAFKGLTDGKGFNFDPRKMDFMDLLLGAAGSFLAFKGAKGLGGGMMMNLIAALVGFFAAKPAAGWIKEKFNAVTSGGLSNAFDSDPDAKARNELALADKTAQAPPGPHVTLAEPAPEPGVP